ncbi:YdiU family protein [Colwellia asteriadis]|uniref:Protein nucleotidyltransferase YdiU n=1 Tax=Colwellia asteriadis TaxID=517723 RepID=A0ABN1L2F0_9GAMM
MPLKLSNTYLSLGRAFSQQSLPTPVRKPELLLWNEPLAKQLAIEVDAQQENEQLALYFSGNELVEGSQPVAQAYSGHQFGQFNPQLGDGRAHLLGDITDTKGKQWDIQLKGSGVSAFSRQGDGRCALGPALREFIMSEAMHALGVPTTRCLAVVATGEAVYREQPLPGAVVTRVAASHIRVGTFQYFSARRDTASLIQLTRYAIERHFPDILPEKPAQNITQDNKPDERELSAKQVVDFVSAVLNKQLTLVLSWLRVGFIHGVMNTDNTAISGETIDYGPCAMMNHYHGDTVFSSIDRRGRYAFGKQAGIMQWNMARFAECLIPVIEKCLVDEGAELTDSDDEHSEAIALLEPLLVQFSEQFKVGYLAMMAKKIGIAIPQESDVTLINDLLELMQRDGRDYTGTFTSLNNNLTAQNVNELLHKKDTADESADTDDWLSWTARWYARIGDDIAGAKVLMGKSNPLVIPRNHHVERVLKTTQESGNLTALQQFLAVLRQPYVNLVETVNYQDAPADGDINYHTFCGT